MSTISVLKKAEAEKPEVQTQPEQLNNTLSQNLNFLKKSYSSPHNCSILPLNLTI